MYIRNLATKENVKLLVTCVLGGLSALVSWYNQKALVESVGKKVGNEIVKNMNQEEPEQEQEEGA